MAQIRIYFLKEFSDMYKKIGFVVESIFLLKSLIVDTGITAEAVS